MSPWYLNVRDDPRFHFKVEAGVVNYAGDFNAAPSGDGPRYSLTVINRSARMMIGLDRDFPGVQQKYRCATRENCRTALCSLPRMNLANKPPSKP